jgi:YbbR domain-containing protein
MIIWLRDTIGLAATAVVRSVASLRENWGVGMLSVVLAVALWVFVTDQDNPDVTGTVPGTITVTAVNVPGDQAVFSLSPASIRVRVEAPESVFEDLQPDDFTASIDLANVSSQQAVVPVRVETSRGRVAIIDTSPAAVTVRLENVTSRAVPVETNLTGAPPPGFGIGTTTVQPEEAVVRGPESLVAKVATVEVDVNLTGIRTDFQETLLLQARDASGVAVQGLSIEPESAVVTVELEQLELRAEFVVVPDISGAPAAGFVVTGLEVTPAFVVISGPVDVFQTLDPAAGVRTERISIDGASGDVVRPVALVLPAGATVEQIQTVTVRIIIQPFGAATPTSGGP